jgi:transcriptional regulator GlxA family with amidase domain
LPNYSLIAVANALEPLRMANRLVGKEVYEWSSSAWTARRRCQQRTEALADRRARQARGGRHPVRVRRHQRPRGRVARAADGAAPAGRSARAAGRPVHRRLCAGARRLAGQFRATIHWENLSALREEFPRVRISDQLFTIDRDRFTCSGGTAPLDLMLNLIEMKLGPRISQLVSEQFIVDRVRKDTDRQYIPLRAQVGVSHRGLIRVAQLMEENIEKPLSLEKSPRRPVCRAGRSSGCSSAT